MEPDAVASASASRQKVPPVSHSVDVMEGFCLEPVSPFVYLGVFGSASHDRDHPLTAQAVNVAWTKAPATDPEPFGIRSRT